MQVINGNHRKIGLKVTYSFENGVGSVRDDDLGTEREPREDRREKKPAITAKCAQKPLPRYPDTR
jgi:hypothetical protein